VSRTTACADGSGNVGVTRLADERQELLEFLVGLERVAPQFVGRADRVRARRLTDQFLQRQQILAATPIVLIFGARARPDHLRPDLTPVSHFFRLPGDRPDSPVFRMLRSRSGSRTRSAGLQQFEEADGRPRETYPAGLPAVRRGALATLLAPIIQ